MPLPVTQVTSPRIQMRLRSKSDKVFTSGKNLLDLLSGLDHASSRPSNPTKCNSKCLPLKLNGSQKTESPYNLELVKKGTRLWIKQAHPLMPTKQEPKSIIRGIKVFKVFEMFRIGPV